MDGRRMGRVAGALLALLAFACGFALVAGGLDATQPSVRGATTQVQFEVRSGDNATAVADRLEREGLIRNALVFRLLARVRHLDTHIEAGIYDLSPAMSTESIIARLVLGHPDQRVITIPEGLRVTQYPPYFAALPRFSATGFLKIAASGQLPDGTRLWEAYWYVAKPQATVPYALEGYLFPDTYAFNPTDDETAVVRRMLDTLGEHLCPSANLAHPDAYIHDRAQCRAHGVPIGPQGIAVFTALEQRYFTTDDTRALHDALTLASLAIREIVHSADAQGVTDVFYNRYLVSLGKIAASADHEAFLGSDPSAEYARDTAQPPAAGKWWAALADKGANIAAPSLYNSDVPAHTGLIPGPVAAPGWLEIAAAADPNPAGSSPYFFFVGDHCGAVHYAKQLAEFMDTARRAVDLNKCWTT
jgi:UPF0755 protein